MKTSIASFLAAFLLFAAAGDATRASDTTTAGGDPAPVYTDSSEILYLESYPVQVQLSVQGSLPTPCHEAAYEVFDLGSAIDVQLWSLVDPDTICITVLEPFEISIPLGSFKTANQPVFLNGEEVGRIEIGTDSAEASLLGSGWSFGMCLGYCMADMVIEGHQVSLAGGSRATEEPLYRNRGTLTSDGQARLRAALATLGRASLDPVYGCPDCADGGAAYLGLARGGIVERIQMEYSNPPDVLAELYSISASLIDALESCTSSRLVDVARDCAAYEGS